jgi:hypothetical protein
MSAAESPKPVAAEAADAGVDTGEIVAAWPDRDLTKGP